MKKRLLLSFTALLVLGQYVFAYDFSYTYQGKTLYYTIQGSTNVSVDNPTSGNYYNYVSGDVVIPDSVENNGTMYAVTSIGEDAFSGCSSLTSVTIPNSVTSIDYYAFSGCSSLSSVTIPNSVTLIGYSAFSGCSSLTSVAIPNSVTSIYGYAFWGCSSLASVTIGNSVTNIDAYAFWDCSSLTSVTMGNSVTSIGDFAFVGCSALTSVTIPSSVTNIGSRVFYGCSGLTSIVVETGNTHYDSRDSCNAIIQTDLNLLIQGCNNTIIPNTVTAIGNYAFSSCRGMTSVTIPNSVTSIGNYAFQYCGDLTSVTIPNSVITIGNYAFSDCNGLTSVTISNSVISIGDLAFSNCTGLTSVTIPNAVTSIGDAAFFGCTGLTAVYCEPIIPPSLTANTWNHFSNTNNCPIYVPCGSVSTYQSANRWSNYSSRIHGMPFGLEYSYSFLSNNDTMGVVLIEGVDCDSNIHIKAYAHPGYQFHGWSDGYVATHYDTIYRIIHLTSDTVVTALFGHITYIVTGQPNNTARGTVTGSDTVYYGDSVTLTATANYGYHFQRWQDNNTDNPRTVVVTQNRTYTAYFQPNTYTVTVHSADSSQGTVSGSGTVNYLSNRHITATPTTGYHFSHWSDGDSNVSRYITVEGDTTLTAYFAINSYQLTVLPNDSTLGTVTGSGIYTHGTQVTVTATPTAGNRFDRWSDNTLLSSYTFPLTDNLQLVAVFVPTDTVFVHDTTYITVTDTLTVYDTTIVNIYIHDTTYVHDTTLVTDTLWLTEYLHDTIYLPQYLHDTIYVYDTIYVGVDEVDMLNAKVYINNGQIVVEGADGNNVWLYDVNGRVLATKQDYGMPIRFDAPASGTYMIKVGNHPARKVVLIR